eukprot:3636739-Ditylum_brightwellii.AAC.2
MLELADATGPDHKNLSAIGNGSDNGKHVPRALQGMKLAMSYKEDNNVRMPLYNEAKKRLYADDDNGGD